MSSPPPANPAPDARRIHANRSRSSRWDDRAFRRLCRSGAVMVLVLAGGIVFYLTKDSWPAITSQGFGFFTRLKIDTNKGEYGALAYIWGTIVTSAIAMLLAVPLGVGTAVFLAELAPNWLRRTGSFLIELLAAIPSVVYGFWGLFFIAPYIQALAFALGGENTGGSGLLSAGIVLAIMILPYITAISFDVLRAVPTHQVQASLALGATRWQMIWSVLLPYARPGIIGASFLALGRALGETMAVTMLCGNKAEINLNVFLPGDSIASVLANQLNEATDGLHRAALVMLGLVLLLVTFIVNTLARILIWQMNRQRQFTLHNLRPPRLTWLPRLDPHLVDRTMRTLLGCCFVVTLLPLFLILGYITYRGAGSLDWDLFTQLPSPRGEPGGGLAHAMLGSLMMCGLATLFAVPLSLLVAIYLSEYRSRRLAPTVRFVGELLGGVPSIVVGVFAYAVLVDQGSIFSLGGFSGWAGAFALGVMMVPIVMRSAEESLKLVPQSLRLASQALGATEWQTILRVSVPAALPSIITGVFLALARIAGETAPLLLTAYNSIWWPRSPSDRTPFLPYYIYSWSQSGYPDEERQAWAAAFVLLCFVMIINVGIRFLTGKRVVLASKAD